MHLITLENLLLCDKKQMEILIQPLTYYSSHPFIVYIYFHFSSACIFKVINHVPFLIFLIFGF